MKKITFPLLALLLSLLLVTAARAQSAVVQAILFYSPACPHCHEVITNVLPPLKEQYGSQLQLLGIDTRNPAGSRLYSAALEKYGAPDSSGGIPALLVGDVLLIGSRDIPEQFPALIELGLANGGIGWPELPGLQEAIPDLPPSAGGATDPTAVSQPESATAADLPAQQDVGDGVLIESTLDASAVPPSSGYGVAWLVMIGMIGALGYTFWRVFRTQPLQLPSPGSFVGWAIPIMAVIGLVVAAYLAYIEITQSTAVCGPVGDCNAVQASPYAAILGVPIAVLGLVFYLAVIAIWAFMRFGDQSRAWPATALLLLTIAGTLFSIYLTALELFVIEAVCAWCLSSAVVTAALMLYTAQKFNTRVRSANKQRRARQAR